MSKSKSKFNFLYIILLAIIISIIIIIIGYVGKNYKQTINKFYLGNAKPLISNIDGKEYKVHPNLENSQDAADSLATINETLINLITYLKYKYIKTDHFTVLNQQYPIRINAIKKILNRYNPDNLIENSPQDKTGDTSYTLNKGSVMALCLRDKTTTHHVHNLPILIFVAIHELAHVAIEDNEHPPEFWAMFKFLLDEAEAGEIYKCPNFNKIPADYCGLNVDYSPSFDSGVKIIY